MEQIYVEAWRQMRDFFYVEKCSVDWQAIDKYVMLPFVKNRHDLNYLWEMIGELNVGHAYIWGRKMR